MQFSSVQFRQRVPLILRLRAVFHELIGCPHAACPHTHTQQTLRVFTFWVHWEPVPTMPDLSSAHRRWRRADWDINTDFSRPHRPHLHGSPRIVTTILKMSAQISSETSVAVYPSQRRHIPKDSPLVIFVLKTKGDFSGNSQTNLYEIWSVSVTAECRTRLQLFLLSNKPDNWRSNTQPSSACSPWATLQTLRVSFSI